MATSSDLVSSIVKLEQDNLELNTKVTVLQAELDKAMQVIAQQPDAVHELKHLKDTLYKLSKGHPLTIVPTHTEEMAEHHAIIVESSAEASTKPDSDPLFSSLTYEFIKTEPLTNKEANVLMQLPPSVIKTLINYDKIKTTPTYDDICAFYNNVPEANKGSYKKPLKYSLMTNLLSDQNVKDILGINQAALLDLVKSGLLAAVQVNNTNRVYTYKAVDDYVSLQTCTKPVKHTLVKHVFYKMLYIAAANDHKFKWVEHECIYGKLNTSDLLNIAHALLCVQEPTLKKMLVDKNADLLGTLSVREWLLNYRKEYLYDMINLGFIGYLVKYCSYDKLGNMYADPLA